MHSQLDGSCVQVTYWSALRSPPIAATRASVPPAERKRCSVDIRRGGDLASHCCSTSECTNEGPFASTVVVLIVRVLYVRDIRLPNALILGTM